MAIQTEPTRIQIPFADSGTKNVIPDTNSTPSASQAASWTDGFPSQCSLPLSAGGIPPARADFNGILNTMTQSERFTQEGGVWAWDATVDYGTNRMVLGSDGLLYWSIAQSGPNVGGAQDPTADASHTYWQAIPTNDANVVHIAGTETVSGSKTFDAGILVNQILNFISSGNYFLLKQQNLEKGTLPSSGRYLGINFTDKNGNTYNRTQTYVNTDGSSGWAVSAAAFDNMGTGTYSATFALYLDKTASSRIAAVSNVTTLRPDQGNGSVTLGTSSNRWGVLYTTTNPNVSSDERLKNSIQSFPDSVLDAWGEINWVEFKYNISVEEKGENARIHSGMIAQQAKAAFLAHDVDPERYGFFCWDEWDAESEIRDPDGTLIRESREAGEEYSVRYVEALCIEAAYQRRRADRAEARLAALEERLAAIEAKLA